MKRYQVYLNPSSVSTLDEYEKYTSISRSQLIREVIDRLAQNLAKVFAERSILPEENTILDSLIGVITLDHKRKTHFATNSDQVYLKD